MKPGGKDVLALIPARGGSKSIPRKNMVDLDGRPLITYVIVAALHSPSLERIVCSTDDEGIGSLCKPLGIEVVPRPADLAGDDTPIVEVMLDVLKTLEGREGYVPWSVALLQPTSPFLLPSHLEACIGELRANPRAASAQTVTPIPHNFHAYNQRMVQGKYVRFRFPKQRAACYNKQRKPPLYAFGNVVVTRVRDLKQQRQVFARPSVPVVIPPAYAHDVDGREDLEVAAWYAAAGKVSLPPMERPEAVARLFSPRVPRK